MSSEKDFDIKNGVLKKYKGSGGDVVIPAGVTVIGKESFFCCFNLQSVTLPEGTTTIERAAFMGCRHLSAVKLPPSLIVIDDNAFADCNLTDIILPDHIKSIGRRAFADCKIITQLSLVTQDIARDAFPASPLLFVDVNSLQELNTLPGYKAIVLRLLKNNHVSERIVTCKKDSDEGTHALHELQILQAGRINYGKYDDFILHGSKKYPMSVQGKLRAVLYRLLNPIELDAVASEKYVAFAKQNIKPLLTVIVKDQEPELANVLFHPGIVDNDNRSIVIKALKKSCASEIKAIAATFDHSPQDKPAETNHRENDDEESLKKEYVAGFEKLGGEKKLQRWGISQFCLPKVKLRNSEEFAPASLIAYLLLAYGSQYVNTKKYAFHPEPDADTAAELLDEESLSNGLIELFDGIDALEHIQIIPACCRYCNSDDVVHLISTFHKWGHWNKFGLRGQNAKNIGYDALVLSNTRQAILWSEKYGRLEQYASIRNTGPSIYAHKGTETEMIVYRNKDLLLYCPKSNEEIIVVPDCIEVIETGAISSETAIEICLGENTKIIRTRGIYDRKLERVWLSKALEDMEADAIDGCYNDFSYGSYTKNHPYVMFYNPSLIGKISNPVYLGSIEDIPVYQRTKAIEGFLYAEQTGIEEIKPWRKSYLNYLKRNAKTYLERTELDETCLRVMIEAKAITIKILDILMDRWSNRPDVIASLLEYKQAYFSDKQIEPFSMAHEDAAVRQMEKMTARQNAIKGQRGIKGISFVATGYLESFGADDDYTDARDLSDLKAFIEERGGHLRSAVSSKTDYLISNDPNSASQKMQKAKELGVLIITEEEFLKMANESE